MRRSSASSALIALVACGSDSAEPPPAPAPRAAPAAKPTPPARPVVADHALPVLTLAARDAAARAVEARFPATWKPTATVDAAGLPETLELQVDPPITDATATERVLAIVRERPDVFGVRDAKRLAAWVRYAQVYVGEGERWTGELSARVAGRHVKLEGHVWPVDSPAVPIELAEAAIRPFIGQTGSAPSKCLPPCDKVAITLVRESFTLEPATALVCRDGVFHPRAAIAIEVVPGNIAFDGRDRIPRLIDAITGEAIDDDFVMPRHGWQHGTGVELVHASHYSFRHSCMAPR